MVVGQDRDGQYCLKAAAIKKSRGLKVLFVSPGYKPYLGGTERVIEQLGAEYLRHARIDKVGVLTTFMDFNEAPPRENRSLPAWECYDGIEVYRLHFWPRRLRYFYCLPVGLFSLRVREVIRQFRPDVVHFMLSEWYVVNLWVWCVTRSSSKHVFTVSFHERPENARYRLMKYGNTLLARIAHRVHVWSPFIKKRVMEYLHVPSSKITIVPGGYAHPKNGWPSRKASERDGITLVSVGRLSSDKGQLELVRVFEKVMACVRRRLKLILVGGNGGDREAIEDYVAENNLSDRVELRGFVPEETLHEIYGQADIFVLLTRVESFGIVFAEAQSHGLPILAYGIGPLVSAFKKGGILVEPFDQDKMAAALVRLVQDDQLRESLSREARAYARQNFSWKNAAKSMIAVYDDIVEATY